MHAFASWLSVNRGGSRIFERGGGVQIRSTSKKGGARRGSNFGPNVKKPTSWHKRGGPTLKFKGQGKINICGFEYKKDIADSRRGGFRAPKKKTCIRA